MLLTPAEALVVLRAGAALPHAALPHAALPHVGFWVGCVVAATLLRGAAWATAQCVVLCGVGPTHLLGVWILMQHTRCCCCWLLLLGEKRMLPCVLPHRGYTGASMLCLPCDHVVEWCPLPCIE